LILKIIKQVGELADVASWLMMMMQYTDCVVKNAKCTL